MNVILSSLIGAILGGLLSFRSNKDNLNDSLDSKSGWRKQLFDVASKDNIVYDDVFRVRACLRLKKYEADNIAPFSFRWMSNRMIEYFDSLIEYHEKYNINTISSSDKEVIRIYSRYLLKNHWEYRSSMGPKTSNFKEDRNRCPQKYAYETIELLEGIKMVETKSSEQYVVKEETSYSNSIGYCLISFSIFIILGLILSVVPKISINNYYGYWLIWFIFSLSATVGVFFLTTTKKYKVVTVNKEIEELKEENKVLNDFNKQLKRENSIKHRRVE